MRHQGIPNGERLAQEKLIYREAVRGSLRRRMGGLLTSTSFDSFSPSPEPSSMAAANSGVRRSGLS